jgi:hypothetical protein
VSFKPYDHADGRKLGVFLRVWCPPCGARGGILYSTKDETWNVEEYHPTSSSWRHKRLAIELVFVEGQYLETAVAQRHQ